MKQTKLASTSVVEALEERRLMATFVVTTNVDSGPGSLRQAIQSANATPAADVIQFNLAGAGLKTIDPMSELPAITSPVTINGFSQPGSSANTNTIGAGANAVPLIEINATGLSRGLELAASNSTIRGLVINRAAGDGILVSAGTNNVIAGNFIGTNGAGTAGLGNERGITVLSTDNRIGGTAAADRNVISGNKTSAIVLGNSPFDETYSQADRTTVAGNYIGTNRSGTAAIANGGGLSWYSSTDVTIGGATVEAGNVISGNTSKAIGLIPGGNTRLVIRNNLIGTNAAGTATVPNGGGGIHLDGAFDQVDVQVRDNVISGNTGTALLFTVNGTEVRNAQITGNFIGTDRAMSKTLGNTGNGIEIGGLDNLIKGNVVAHNKADGIAVGYSPSSAGGSGPATGLRNHITENRIYWNQGQAINIGAGENDVGDADTGANGLQNTPVISFARGDAGNTTVGGSLDSTPNRTFKIEFFRCPMLIVFRRDATQFLGSTTVTTDAAGKAWFTANLPGGLVGGSGITATATEVGGVGADVGNTSELSDPRRVLPYIVFNPPKFREFPWPTWKGWGASDTKTDGPPARGGKSPFSQKNVITTDAAEHSLRQGGRSVLV